jgi:fructuronate reductase
VSRDATAPVPLSRRAGHGRRAAPVRIVHLGLGNFFRAHAAWYTDRAPDAAEWGIAAFAGRSAALARDLDAQEGLYTLVTRAADGDAFDVVSSLSKAHAAEDAEAWAAYLASDAVALVTMTITEAGYLRGAGGGADPHNADLRADVEALRADPRAATRTAPARLVRGLLGRRAAGAGPITVVSCDNLPDNGTVLSDVVRDVAALVDPTLATWCEDNVSFVTTVVDRITPRATPGDAIAVASATGRRDLAPVVTEPFSEWVLGGEFVAGRPAWDLAGATITNDVTPYERRKLWMLNGAHSLLAYGGSARGHETVASAVGDDVCRRWIDEWWDEAGRHLAFPPAEVDGYRAALVERFSNPRIAHTLAQIAEDGATKIGVRIVPVLARERAERRSGAAAVRVLAAWVCHLRGRGAPVKDTRGPEFVDLARGDLAAAVPRVLERLSPAAAADRAVVDAVVSAVRELGGEAA